jgi:hypothetical protein
VTCDSDINRDGLPEAANDLLGSVQRRLYRYHDASEPLEVVGDSGVVILDGARFTALRALVLLGGTRLAKDVEASVAPNGQPLAICVGSTTREQVQVYFRGRLEEWPMSGYLGCLHTFPDAPFGPGRRWPRQCSRCRPRRTNHRKAAQAALRRRAVELTDAINSRASE